MDRDSGLSLKDSGEMIGRRMNCTSYLVQRDALAKPSCKIALDRLGPINMILPRSRFVFSRTILLFEG
jgi:hypothetical protein